MFVCHAAVHQPPHVPKLVEDPSARFMPRRRHGLPAFDLFGGPQARRIGPAQALPRHADALADDEARRSALAIIVDRKEHTSELQSLMRISYAVFCLTNKNIIIHNPAVTDKNETSHTRDPFNQ